MRLHAFILIGLGLAMSRDVSAARLVLHTVTEGAPEESLAAIESALDDVARFRVIELVSVDNRGPRDPAQVSPLRKCGSDRACMSRALQVLGADLCLLFVVNGLVQPAVAAIELIGPNGGNPVATWEGELPSASTLRPTLRAAIAEVLAAGGHPELGRVVVRAHPMVRVEFAAAQLVATHEENESREHLYLVRPGLHSVDVALADQKVARQITAIGGREETVVVDLAPQDTILQSPWFWALTVGAVVIGGVVAIAVSAGGGSQPCVCISTVEPCPPEC